MRRIRVIPVLLISKGGLVKSVKFKNYKYVGDPINAVKIFNEKGTDEMVILDIDATRENRSPNFEMIKEIASEAFMPMAYGGGISSVEEIKKLFNLGVEKIILNNAAVHDPSLVTNAAGLAGSQSVVVSIDVKKNMFGKYRVYTRNGTENTNNDPVEFAHKMQRAGAGEIFLNAIDRDGTYSGYDGDLVKKVSSGLSIPLIACGGAADINDLCFAVEQGASAVAAGSMFVFQRPHQAVLINYPAENELKEKLFQIH
ncbi:MAG TPA: AglZ/HisF2 family acetamidino modification protein [Puia sp.]|nr:AglZ/HisF2 family acetamidino modification protein [Puia sp.]